MQRADVIVLGAGVVGVSAAWELLKRGRSVVLVDRREPGEETSFGNSGVIERDAFVPIGFPPLHRMPRYALGLAPELNFHWRFLPRIVPWLMALWHESNPAAVARYAAAMNPLLAEAAPAHRRFATVSGASRYFRETGWIRLYRTDAGFRRESLLRHMCRQYQVRFEVMSADETVAVEPFLGRRFTAATLFPDTISVSSPGGVTKAYASGFRAEGGRFVRGDARSLRQADGAWSVETAEGAFAATDAVVALGPWSPDAIAPLGYRLPLAVKRGYHRHFRAIGNATLSRPVVDVESGFLMTPMEAGMRITTGIEFADRDAPPTPVQIARVLPLARQLFPLGEPVGDIWMGRRPSFPDALPVICPAHHHKGLWFDFGHGHLGFTLGPPSARLLADLMTKARPFADPAPFDAARFDRAGH
jgi:D-amino-acid dehydrogenase